VNRFSRCVVAETACKPKPDLVHEIHERIKNNLNFTRNVGTPFIHGFKAVSCSVLFVVFVWFVDNCLYRVLFPVL
jgi:hypothetical protein